MNDVYVCVHVCVCVQAYFTARAKLVEVLRDSATAVEFKLHAGDLLFIDNMRCLHGHAF